MASNNKKGTLIHLQLNFRAFKTPAILNLIPVSQQ